MKSFRNYLNRYVSKLVSDEEFDTIISHFTYKKIGRRDYLLEQGEISKHLAFILKGAMRKYYIDNKGKEYVVDLYIENWWPEDRESYVLETPSVYNIEAWENCELLLITKEDTVQLSKKCPVFTEMLLRLDERNKIATQKRITSTISSAAKDRYDDFVKSYPEFLQRFPQHIIASYLGITKDTLSRVRKQAFKG
ncbi:Crp/Fnr family transcriptional regulator [Belliella marina]|uniref:Crp/Fnr family transcriptional regulator n=1 Tax=Belliella marina TaxID=1644146 RepID=A0ABW4VN02_9BACT